MWIRHCKRAWLYEQGKLLYEKGGLNTDNLPEDVMINVEEDYQVCARIPARDEGKEHYDQRRLTVQQTILIQDEEKILTLLTLNVLMIR